MLSPDVDMVLNFKEEKVVQWIVECKERGRRRSE